MRKVLLSLFLCFILVGVVGFVSAIECSQADYDKDGDVDFSDLFSFRQCYNQTFTENCSIWDFNDNKNVGDDDLASFKEWYQQECPATCMDAVSVTQIAVGKYTKFNLDDGTANIQVRVGSLGGNRAISLTGIQFVFTVGDEKHVEIDARAIGSNEEKVYNFDKDYLNGISNLKIEIAPILMYNGVERICDISSSIRASGTTPVENITDSDEENETSICTDSDGGLDYYVKGKTSGYYSGVYSTSEDVCSSDNNTHLKELYCSENQLNSAEYSCPQGCKDGVCIKGEEVKEQVTCVFQNSDVEQKCYTAGENDRAYCSGVGSCVAYIKGYKDEQITWKSSCGQYQYTTMDGNNEKVGFDCSSGETNITEIQNKGFRYAYVQCYNGEESKDGGKNKCNLIESIKKDAVAFCEGKCYKDGSKCGINSFSVWRDCYLDEQLGFCQGQDIQDCCARWAKENNLVLPACVGGWNIENDKCSYSCKVEEAKCKVDSDCPQPKCGEVEKCVGVSVMCDNGKCVYGGSTPEPVLICKNSCALEGKCYPFGYRKDGNFCFDEGGFVEQLGSGQVCDNNFECESNVCVSGECVDSGLMQRVINWFKRLFS